MKIILSVFLLILLSCNQTQQYKLSPLDSIKIKYKAAKWTDSMMAKAKTDNIKHLYDKSLSNCPVKIKRCRIVKEDYGSEDIEVTVKNTSGKKINGIKISWILYNNFDEKVDDLHENGISQHILSPGKSDTYTWDLYASTATKSKAYIYSIHFTDGSTWQVE